MVDGKFFDIENSTDPHSPHYPKEVRVLDIGGRTPINI
jgi:hypothetical protein